MSDNKGMVGLEWAVAAIRVGNRHCKDHGDLNPLVASIKRVGLLQPITITPDGFLICGARRLAAIKLLGWKTVRVWVSSGLSDLLGQLLAEQDENVLHKPLTQLEAAGLYRELKALLAEDAAKRRELTQFHTGYAPGEHSGEKLPTPTGPYGRTSVHAAAMVPGGVSNKTFDKIGYLEKVTADATMPDELRARARTELDRIEAGGPVDPAFVRIRNEADAPPGTSDAELHRLAEEALASVKVERRAKQKKIRKPIPFRRSDAPFPARAFVLTWGELTIEQKNGRLGKPTTQGKIERFHTTLKQWLAAQPPAQTLTDLHRQLQDFHAIYNTQRPHRAIGRRTPEQGYTAIPPDHPTMQLHNTDWRVRYYHVDNHGKVTLRYAGKLRHLGIGHAHNRKRIIILVHAADAIAIDPASAEIIAEYTIDPAKNYQPKKKTPPKTPKKSPHPLLSINPH